MAQARALQIDVQKIGDTYCMGCGHELGAARRVCCAEVDFADGSYENAYCIACCGHQRRTLVDSNEGADL